MKEALPKLKLKTSTASPSATSLQELEAGLLHYRSREFPRLKACGRAVRRASLLVWLEQGKEKTTHVTWLLPFSISSQTADLHSCLGSKLQQQLPKISGSILYSLNWRKKATPAGLPYSQLVASAHRTKETDSSLVRTTWPSPCAQNGTVSGYTDWEKVIKRKEAGRQQNLQDVVILSAWATPTANDYKGSGETVIRKDGKDRTFDRLDYSTEQGLKITQPIRITVSGQTLTGLDAGMESSGRLNPAHSRWLMGFPPEWDDCAATAMQSYQKSLPNSSVLSWRPLTMRLRVKK